jgi:BASS family bile acid:Na+ symporter
MLSGPEKALLALLLIVLMTGMGATLERSHVRDVLAKPRGVLVGLASQFGWMPLIATGLALALGLPNELALGLLIVGCTPGGTTSNLFAYLSRADVALSIAMTAIGTVVAVVAMPVVLWLYGRNFTDSSFALPIKDIVVTLLLVLVPVALGMFIRSRSVAWAERVEKVGSASGIGVLILLIVSGLVNNNAIFTLIPFGGYIAAISLGLIGMVLGYLAAALGGLMEPQRRAVALETGIQNSPLAIAIILASFPASSHDVMLRLPLLYALCILITSTALALALRMLGASGPNP